MPKSVLGKGRVIITGESNTIPEHYIPAFKPAKIFMEQVKKTYKPGPGEGPKEPESDEVIFTPKILR